MRLFNKLSHKDLTTVASLCGSMAVLMLAAVVLGGGITINLGGSRAALSAATALGDQQGVPPGLTGMTFPDYTLCHYLLDGKNTTPPPYCQQTNLTANQDTFYVGVFSAHLSGSTGQTSYQRRTMTVQHVQSDGPPTCPSGGGILFNPNTGTYQCGAVLSKGGTVTWYGNPSCPYAADSVVSNGAKSPTYDCQQTIPNTLSAPSTYSAGSAPTVSPGQAVTLEWSCLPSRQENLEGCNYSTFDSSCHMTTYTYYAINLASSVSGSGTGFSPSGLYGTQNVTAPSSAGTYNYTLTCNGGSTAMTTSLVVSISPPPSLSLSAVPNPTNWNSGTKLVWSATGGQSYDACYIGGGQYGGGVSVAASGSANTNAITSATQYSFWCHDTFYGWTGPVYATVSVTPPATPITSITANNQTSLSVRAGTPVSLNATFAPSGNDVGQSSDIEGAGSNPGGQTGALTTTSWAGNKSYTFTPAVNGTYTFYARAATMYYPTLTTYATVTVNVVTPPATPAGNSILGWGWSDQIGWVSLNWYTDPTSPYAYGLTVSSSGAVTGHAWNDNIGWLSANSADVSACGAAPILSQSTHQLSGWLRAVNSNSSSWDGCISLSGAGYAVTISNSASANSGYNNYSNAAWSPTVPQWIVFNGYCQSTTPVCTDSTHYTLYQYCFQQTTTCSGSQICQNGTGCVTSTPPMGCLQAGAVSSCSPPVKSYRLQSGKTMTMYWNLSGVNVSCDLIGSDGEQWLNITSGAASGSGTVTTAPLTKQTTFTLNCDNGLFTDKVTANMSPVIIEI